MRVSRLALLAALTVFFPLEIQAAECPHPGALGTARTLEVDAANTPRVGLKSFPQTLPLADKEVVLTFDDGPSAPTTLRILEALAQECVRATFFMIGESAANNPGLVRRMGAAGHTVAHHTWSHANLGKLPTAEAVTQIERGMQADDTALYGRAGATPATPFFRFPYFESTPALLNLLQSRGIVVFGADFWASDWNLMQPNHQLHLIIERLTVARKGIILFHDTKPQTAAMLADFLKYLRENQYRVVHIVPARRDTPTARHTP